MIADKKNFLILGDFIKAGNMELDPAYFNYQVNDRTKHQVIEIAEGVVFLFGVDHPSADQKK